MLALARSLKCSLIYLHSGGSLAWLNSSSISPAPNTVHVMRLCGTPKKRWSFPFSLPMWSTRNAEASLPLSRCGQPEKLGLHFLSLNVANPVQNNHTYQKRSMTAAKKPSHTLQPTPVLSAIRSIRFIVPLSLTRVLSNESFTVLASFVESRISSPMATVIWICQPCGTARGGKGGSKGKKGERGEREGKGEAREREVEATELDD